MSMANSNLVEVTMEKAGNVIFRAIYQTQGKSKQPDEARIYNFVDVSDVSDSSFWKE